MGVPTYPLLISFVECRLDDPAPADPVLGRLHAGGRGTRPVPGPPSGVVERLLDVTADTAVEALQAGRAEVGRATAEAGPGLRVNVSVWRLAR